MSDINVRSSRSSESHSSTPLKPIPKVDLDTPEQVENDLERPEVLTFFLKHNETKLFSGTPLINTPTVFGALFDIRKDNPFKGALSLIAMAVTVPALSIVNKVNKSRFKQSVKKSGLDQNLMPRLMRDFGNFGHKASKMNLLALQIKYDGHLTPSEKADLLQPFVDKAKQNEPKLLKEAYTDLLELKQLKSLFQDHFPDVDFSHIKGQSFETFYRKAKAQVGGDLPFSRELTSLQKTKGRKDLLANLEKEYGSDSHFWKRLSDLHKQDSKPKKA